MNIVLYFFVCTSLECHPAICITCRMENTSEYGGVKKKEREQLNEVTEADGIPSNASLDVQSESVNLAPIVT